MGEGPAVYIGVHIAARGHPRLGAGLVIQQAVGLRPSELLGRWGQDVVLPEDRASVDFAVLSSSSPAPVIHGFPSWLHRR